jgi:D-aspartate ligase
VTTALRTPAVVVSGHTMALAVVRALGEAGVPVAVIHYDERDMAQASRYVVANIRVPHPVHDEGRFIEALIEAGRRFDGAILIPASDESTVAVSRHKMLLGDRYVVACPDWDITERFIDKTKTYALADLAGVPVPRTVVLGGQEDLKSCAAEIGFPLLLKPAESHMFYEHFKRKMFRAETFDELSNCYARAAEAGLKVMLQEIVPGSDSSVVNYNAYVWNGRALVEFTARQLRKGPPAFGSPRVAISERIPEVVEPGRKVLGAMGFHGFACTEFKLDDRDGKYKLLEVNGRHNLSGMLAVRCGVNFPLMHYQHLAEGVIPTGTTAQPGIYWTDVFRDVGYSLAYLRRERFRPTDYLAPYARRHCDAILDRRDTGPAWARFRYLVRNIGSTARDVRRG